MIPHTQNALELTPGWAQGRGEKTAETAHEQVQKAPPGMLCKAGRQVPPPQLPEPPRLLPKDN